ncbi:MAG: hypothetical protein LBB19_03905 [Puniceicoccales bacterium]|nr:hypothetical protein [Puniceicoccales bacterium]
MNPQEPFRKDQSQISDLRTRAADLVPLEDDESGQAQEQKARIAGWKKWLAIEDFQYIARVVERPIVVITNVDNVWNYHAFGTDGNHDTGVINGQMDAEAILDANEGGLFVYHESKDGDAPVRHFQALVHT